MSALLKPRIEIELSPLPELIVETQAEITTRRRFAPIISTCALSLLASTLLFLAIQSAEGVSTTPNLLPLSKSPGVLQKVSLRSAIAERQHGYIALKGELQNQTNHRLKNVEAVVELLNAEGTPLHAESVLITQSALSAHGHSTFEAVVQDVPGTTSYRIQFRHLMGSMLN